MKKISKKALGKRHKSSNHREDTAEKLKPKGIKLEKMKEKLKLISDKNFISLNLRIAQFLSDLSIFTI